MPELPPNPRPRLWRRLELSALVLAPVLAASPVLGLQLFSQNLNGVGIAVAIALLVFSLGVHEAAHGQVALWCGDPTARDLGRITLDPRAHIDPFNTIILPVFLYMTAGFIFGGAKPVPVNMHRLRKPMRDMSLVAIAGPASNFVLAVLFSVAYIIVLDYRIYEPEQMMVELLRTAVIFNILLAAFNLMPVPPLDGSRVMAWLLPAPLRAPYMQVERFGLLIVFGLVFFVPGFQRLLFWSMTTLQEGVFAVATPIVNVLRPVVELFV